MSGQSRTLLFVMDPIESVNIESDSTFVLMLEAQERGHRVLYCQSGDLCVEDAGPVARACPVTLRREAGRHADLGEPLRIVLDDDTDAVFQRKDPPVDAEYVTSTQILALCRRSRVLNRPEGILAANEKLYALNFPDLMPPTRVTNRIPHLVDFMTKLGGEMIVKPLDGKGGEGIFHVRNDDRNLFSILEQSTRFETRRIMAQQYLPSVRTGDKRILLVEGRPLGGVLRIPADRETRANLHVGGRAARAPLDDRDREIIARVAPFLVRDGLFFVGIDVIGGLLTEVNVTSPTGIQEINTLESRRLEAEILDAVEALLASPTDGGTRSFPR